MLKMSVSLDLTGRAWTNTGLAIREFLITEGEGSAWDFFQKLQDKRKEFKLKSPSYNHCQRYFYILKKIGLIYKVRDAPSKIPGRLKSFWSITPGLRDDVRWIRPQAELYPATGKSSVRSGRNPRYL